MTKIVDTATGTHLNYLSATSGAAHVHIAGYTDAPVLDVYEATMTSAAAGGPNDVLLNPTGMNRYTRWMFQVTGITVDSFNLQISLDSTGADLPNSQFLAVSPTGAAKTPTATINANGVYYAVCDGDSGNGGPGNIFFNALYLDRSGNTDDIVVTILARV